MRATQQVENDKRVQDGKGERAGNVPAQGTGKYGNGPGHQHHPGERESSETYDRRANVVT